MVFNWGVIPLLTPSCKTILEGFAKLSDFALEQGLVANGDLVVVTAGSPFGISGTTNTMIVESIGDVLVRGESGYGERFHGHVSLVLSPEAKHPFAVRGRLLVLAKCDETYLPLIHECAGIILQNHIDDVQSEEYALYIARELKKSAIVRADAATRVLKEGQLVTLDPQKSLVYKGVAKIT